MIKLGENWVTEHTTDFEYKKYLILGYLAAVSDEYSKTKLFPSFSEVIKHYKNLVSLKEKKEFFNLNLPKNLKSIDFNSLQFVYENVSLDDKVFEEVERIIDFAIPKFKKSAEEGKSIFDLVESDISIEPVGIEPLNNSRGFFIIGNSNEKKKNVYEYSVSLISHPDDNLRIIHTQFITCVSFSKIYNVVNYKNELIKKFSFSNPGVYLINTSLKFSLENTILPVVRRVFLPFCRLPMT